MSSESLLVRASGVRGGPGPTLSLEGGWILWRTVTRPPRIWGEVLGDLMCLVRIPTCSSTVIGWPVATSRAAISGAIVVMAWASRLRSSPSSIFATGEVKSAAARTGSPSIASSERARVTSLSETWSAFATWAFVAWGFSLR